MSKCSFEVVKVAVGARSIAAALADFANKGGGTITAFSDRRVRSLRELVPAEIQKDVDTFAVVVANFLKLADGKTASVAQRGHLLAAMAESVKGLNADSPLYASCGYPGTQRKLTSTLEELRHWGIRADDLDELAEKVSEPLASKLRSLAVLDRDVSHSLAQLGLQMGTDRIIQATELPTDGCRFGRLLVVADSVPNPVGLRWLRWAVGGGAQVTLVVEHHPENDRLFQAWAEALGDQWVEARSFGAINPLAKNLFGIDAAPANGFVVGINSMADTLSEVEWTLRAVAKHVVDSEDSSDVAIYCRNAEEYGPLISAAAKRLGLRVTISRSVPLLSNSYAKFTLLAIKGCASHDVRALLPLLRSTYLGLSIDAREVLRTVFLEAFAHREVQWRALHESAVALKTEYPWLLNLLEWREQVNKEPLGVAEWHGKVRELGGQWSESAFGSKTFSIGRDTCAQTALLRSLAQIASVKRVYRHPAMTLGQFARFCELTWAETDVTLPSEEDGIRVVTSSEQIPNVAHLYVLGMLEGVFPRRRSEDAILSDAERAAISQHLEGMPLENSHDKAHREREEFYRVCGAPRESITFSYPQTDEDRDNVRAFYLVEVERAMQGVVVKTDFPRTHIVPDVPELPADSVLSIALQEEKMEPLPNKLETGQAVMWVRGGSDRELKISELRDVLQCPFRYLSQDRLELRPNRVRSKWYRLMSLPDKAGLSIQPTRESAQLTMQRELEHEISEMYSEATPHDLALVRAGGLRLIAEWVDREFVSRETWPRESITQHPRFGNELRQKLKTSEGDVFLTGKLPAISKQGDHKVLHLFSAVDPWLETQQRDEPLWMRLREREAFEFGLCLIALDKPGNPVGLEVDCPTGVRNLLITPRPAEAKRSNIAAGLKIAYIDSDERKEWFSGVVRQVENAVRRIRLPVVEATNGEHCASCEYGELCRRSSEYGEDVDPFASLHDEQFR